MSCPDCDALRHEIDRLMGREAYSIPAVHAIKTKLRVSPAAARIIHKLFTEGGKPVHAEKLEAVACKHPYEVSPELIKVYIHHIRAALGFDAIETVYRHGYRLTQRGQQMVAAALQEPVAA